MKILALIGAVVLCSALTFAGAFALVATGDDAASTPLLLLGATGLMPSTYGPVLLGSLLAYWDTNATPRAAAFFRRWVVGVVIAQTVGAAALILDVALGGAAWWVAVVFPAAGVLLTLAAIRVGDALRRREERRGATSPEPWQPLPRETVRRKIRSVIVTFVVGLVIAIPVALALASGFGRPERWGEAVTIALQLPLLAAAFACIIVSRPLGRALRGTADGDLGRMRSYARVVLRRKPEQLSADEERGAARYAAGIAVYLHFQSAYLVLLYAALLAQQVSSLLLGSIGSVIPLTLIGFFVLVLAVVPPWQARRVRRARLYAEAHRELLTA
ncbi:MAG: hypothetical protein HY996_07090 [Micrococcales bacterium]|nr:hypothetical protein [Micrococcales bacterium]